MRTALRASSRCLGYVRPVLADTPFIGFIPVRDLAAARAFYEGTLGLRVVDDNPFALVLDAGGTMLRVTPVPELAARPFTIAGMPNDVDLENGREHGGLLGMRVTAGA